MKHQCLVCLKDIEGTMDEFIQHMTVCNENKKKQEAAVKKQALDKEKALRTEELDNAYKNFETLLYKYQSDYQDIPVIYYGSPYPFGEVISLLKNWTGA